MSVHTRKNSRDISAESVSSQDDSSSEEVTMKPLSPVSISPRSESPSEAAMEALDGPKHPVSRCRARWIYGFMLLMHFMLAVDTTSVAVALPTIAKEMTASKTMIFSLGTVFSLSASIFQQPIAELSHVLGRKPAYLFVLAMFFAGSVVAATANNIESLLAGRAMQGFASGGSVLTAIVLTDLIELKDRATWLTYQNGIQAAGLVLGPLVGAVLLKTSWVWLFWINLPPIVVSAIGLSFLLGFDRPKEGVRQSLAKVDWVGMIIYIPSATAVLVPFTMAGIMFKWNSWKALVPLLTGIAGLIVLAVQQRYFAKRPMFRASLFEKWVTVCSFIGQGVFGICVNMIFYYLVVYWSGVRGYSEIITGVCLLPETIAIPVAAIVCGLSMRKAGRIQEAMYIGWPLTSISIALLYLLDTNTPLGVLLLINGLVGVGAGTVVSALNVTHLASTKREDNGHAIAMGFLFKSAGMCLGIAIGTAVFTAQMDDRLEAAQDAEMVAESFMRMLHNVKDDPAGQEVIVRALRILWWICAGLSAVAGILCCSCKYPGFHSHEETTERATEQTMVLEKSKSESGTVVLDRTKSDETESSSNCSSLLKVSLGLDFDDMIHSVWENGRSFGRSP